MSTKSKLFLKNIFNKGEAKMKITLSNRVILLAGSLFLVLTGCTKEVPFKHLPADEKAQVSSKSLIDTKEEYIYSSSQQNSSMSAADAFPFSSGDNKRVKLEFTENSLRVLEMERDQRYAANPNNNKLVIEIPVQHVQYRCAEDSYGECTNREESNNDVTWSKRDSIKFKFQEVKTAELNLLPIMSSQTFGENCYKEVGSRLIDYKIEKDAINFQVERVFETNIDCLGEINKLSDATISAVYHYSMAKASSVLSKNYQTISYPEGSKDENTFGFFSTQQHKLDVDNNSTEKGTIQIMNRWNPNRKEIVYYLSDEFAKPENKMINDLTVKTVNNLNNGLSEAGVNFRINLKQPAGKVPGDIRNSMIVLVEDPVASSVIGYGPQTEDPVTGEIFSARTIMFLGTIKSNVFATYADIVKEKQALKLQKNLKTLDSKSVLTLAPNLAAQTQFKKQTGKTFGVNSALKQLAQKQAAVVESQKNQANLAGSGNIVPSDKLEVNAIKAVKELRNYTRLKDESYSVKDMKTKFKYLQEVKNCALSKDAGGTSEISQKLMDKFSDDAKPWDQLSESEKEYAMNIILPEIWIPTLIHELGHNLGLRHNFQGSEDKANFYSAEELAKYNIDHTIPFSTVMEYGDDLKALSILGKYDIAALRYGYNREVDVVAKDGSVSVVPVKTTLADLQLSQDQTLKDYGYCTDEHAGINAGCKRFDLGTTYTEITKNLIQTYENMYSLRNFRNGRKSFSLMNDYGYASRISRTFMDLRIMMEVKERIKYRFGLPEGHAIWQQYDWLKDLNDAATLAGQYLTKVLMVPDVTCAVAMKNKPSEVVGIFNIKVLDSDAISCFDADISAGGLSQYADQILVVAQAGKMFNPKKSVTSTNSYVDQIDVRGYWIDKVVATKTLFSRLTGIYNFEKNNDSFLNQAGVREVLLASAEAIMNDNVVDEVEFTLANGQVVPLEIGYDLSDSQVIEKHIWGSFAKVIGLNTDAPTRLQQIVSGYVAREALDKTGANKADAVLSSAFSVYKETATTPVWADPAVSLKMNILGTNYVATKENVIAYSMMSNAVVASTLEKLDEKKVVEIYNSKNKGESMPQSASAEEQAVWALDKKVLSDFLNGVIKTTDYYQDMIIAMPIAK